MYTNLVRALLINYDSELEKKHETDRQTDIHIDGRFTKVAASQRNNSLRERERRV